MNRVELKDDTAECAAQKRLSVLVSQKGSIHRWLIACCSFIAFTVLCCLVSVILPWYSNSSRKLFIYNDELGLFLLPPLITYVVAVLHLVRFVSWRKRYLMIGISTNLIPFMGFVMMTYIFISAGVAELAAGAYFVVAVYVSVFTGAPCIVHAAQKVNLASEQADRHLKKLKRAAAACTEDADTEVVTDSSANALVEDTTDNNSNQENTTTDTAEEEDNTTQNNSNQEHVCGETTGEDTNTDVCIEVRSVCEGEQVGEDNICVQDAREDSVVLVGSIGIAAC